MKPHQKHPPLAKPKLGDFGRNEWAILGTTCSEVKNLCTRLIQKLGKKWNMAYVDADHHAGEQKPGGEDLVSAGAKIVVDDKIRYHQINTKEFSDEYQRKRLFQNMDMVLVNGNHFPAQRQIVIIDPRKEKSLLKRKEQISEVDLILLKGEVEMYPFLKELLTDLEQIPVLGWDEQQAIVDFFKNLMVRTVPELYGLVLAGGKSQRMGFDKGLIEYHGIPQRVHLQKLLKRFISDIFLSCREDQLDELGIESTIADRFVDLGAMGAILTAYSQFPNQAFLVTACDLPFVDEEAVEFLIRHRNPAKLATAFLNPETGFPDPLFTIWEPKAYPQILHFLSLGYSCPRKVLINSEVEVLDMPDRKWLLNVNTPSEMQELTK